MRGSASSALGVIFTLLRVFLPLAVITGLAYLVLTYNSTRAGQVRVTTSQPGADIMIGGIQTGLRSDTTLTLPVGRKILTVRKDGKVSDPEFAAVVIGKDSLTQVHFDLRVAQKPVSTDSLPPPRAIRQEIFSTGEPVHAIPPVVRSRERLLVDYSQRSSRSYSAQPENSRPALQAEEYAPPSESSESREDLGPELPVSPLQGTELTVTSVPDGATIFVNGAETPRTTPYTFQGLDHGLYLLSVYRDGMVTAPESVTVALVEDYQRELASFRLSPDPRLPKPHLTVMTEPLAAGIKIDGEQCGVGECALELNYQTYKITFANAPGYITPEPMSVELTREQPQVQVTGTYEKIIGNSFIAILPAEDLEKFDARKLRVFIDNELILDNPDTAFDATLLGKIVSGKRLIRVEYGGLVNDSHVNLVDGEVIELVIRVESFFSRRSLRVREQASMPIAKWQEKSKRLSVLSLG